MQDEQWVAIVNCNDSYDGVFFYAVKTTGIFCRPSCRSRTPKRDNVCVFRNAENALEANFRPCKRCRPDQLRWPDEELASHTTRFIDEHFNEPLTLVTLAKILHVSPYHLHHIFKRITNMTPSEYLVLKRLSEAKRLLLESGKSITEIAGIIGFVNPGHFSTVFLKKVGMSPTVFRSHHYKKTTEDEVLKA